MEPEYLNEVGEEVLRQALDQAMEMEADAKRIRDKILICATIAKMHGRDRPTFGKHITTRDKWNGVADVVRSCEAATGRPARGPEAHTIGRFYIAAHMALKAEEVPAPVE